MEQVGKQILDFIAADDESGLSSIIPSQVSANSVIQNQSLLFHCIEKNAQKCFHYLVQNKANISKKNKQGQSLLHFAVSKGQLRSVLAVLNFKKDLVNSVDENGWTPLFWAARKRDANIAQILLEFGADPNLTDFEEATALHIAGDSDARDVVEVLLKGGANPYLKNLLHSSAADLIIKRGNGDLLNK